MSFLIQEFKNNSDCLTFEAIATIIKSAYVLWTLSHLTSPSVV